jgi:hypothetical protein
VKVIANWTALRLQKNDTGTEASSVLLRADNGAIRVVKVNKAVIVAGGVIASSHFLMRSELDNPQIGQQISCNFGMPLAFEFDEPIKAFDGEQITFIVIANNLIVKLCLRPISTLLRLLRWLVCLLFLSVEMIL